MPEGSELHTEGAATLKPWEAQVVWTGGTENRLVLGIRTVNREQLFAGQLIAGN